MNNNQFPPLEPEKDLPEILPDIPERMEPLEELPVIEELTFTQEEPAEESAAIPEEPVIEEIPVAAECDSEEGSIVPEEPPVVLDVSSEQEEPLIPEKTAEPLLSEAAPEIEETAADIGDDWLDEEEFPVETILPEPEVTAPAPEEILDQEFQEDDQDFPTMMNSQEPKQDKSGFTMSSGNYKGRPKRKKGKQFFSIFSSVQSLSCV